MVWGTRSLPAYLLVCFLSLLCVSALPTPITEIFNALAILQSNAVAKGTALRIFPVGASIVYGQGSWDGDGFRRALRSSLVAEGSPVKMVGSREAGKMGDNYNDGWPGARTAEIQAEPGVTASLKQMPNVVLVLAGTNDALQGHSPSTMATDITTFIEYILSIATGAVVVVSTLPPNGNGLAEQTIEKYNALLPGVVQTLQNKGQHVTLVDNHSSWWSLNDMQSDGIHPNDEGYVKMARVFHDGIHNVSSWVTAPVNNGLPLMGAADSKSLGDAPVLPKQP